MNKVVKDAKEAILGMEDGQTFMLGGFGLCEFLRILLMLLLIRD